MSAWILLVNLIACGGAATDQAPPPAEGTAAPTEAAPADPAAVAAPVDAAAAAPAAVAGPTKALLDEAAASVQPMQPWGVAETALKAKLGEPKMNDAVQATWVANEGGKCFILTVGKMGDSVGAAAVAEGPC